MFSLCPSFKDFAGIPSKQRQLWHGTLTPAEHFLQHCSHSRTHKEPGCWRKRQAHSHNESPESTKLSTAVAKPLTEKSVTSLFGKREAALGVCPKWIWCRYPKREHQNRSPTGNPQPASLSPNKDRLRETRQGPPFQTVGQCPEDLPDD